MIDGELKPESKHFDILLVEDNPADANLMQISLEATDLQFALHLVPDGLRALDFVHKRAGFEDVPRPDLILLDLNLPRIDGREVLAEIKSIRSLRRIPVIVLSSSDAESDVMLAYDGLANAYIQKPNGVEALMNVARRIESWLEMVRLPSR